MAAKSKKSVFDVTKPGKTPASPSSRPVIEPSDSGVKNSLLAGNDSIAAQSAPVVKKHGELVLKPLSQQAEAPVPPSDTPATLIINEAEPAAAIRETDLDPATDIQEPLQSPAHKPRLAPISDTVAPKSDPEAIVETSETGTPVSATPEVKINELIAQKKYFLPISKSSITSKRRKRVSYMIFLILLVALAAAAVYFDYIELPVSTQSLIP